MAPLRLHPYNPHEDLRSKVKASLDRLTHEHNKTAYDELPPEPAVIESQRAARRKWYYDGGGKAVCAKNNRDRRARLKKEGKL